MSAQASDIDVPLEALLNRTACLVPDVREYGFVGATPVFSAAEQTITFGTFSGRLRAGDVVRMAYSNGGGASPDRDDWTVVELNGTVLTVEETIATPGSAAGALAYIVSAQTWTKPAHALVVNMVGVGPGARGANGESDASTTGGNGGGAGAVFDSGDISASEVGGTLAITVGTPQGTATVIGGLTVAAGSGATGGTGAGMQSGGDGGTGGTGGSGAGAPGGAGDPGASGFPRGAGGAGGVAADNLECHGFSGIGWGAGGGGERALAGGGVLGINGGGGGASGYGTSTLATRANSGTGGSFGMPGFVRITTWCGVNTRT